MGIRTLADAQFPIQWNLLVKGRIVIPVLPSVLLSCKSLQVWSFHEQGQSMESPKGHCMEKKQNDSLPPNPKFPPFLQYTYTSPNVTLRSLLHCLLTSAYLERRTKPSVLLRRINNNCLNKKFCISMPTDQQLNSLLEQHFETLN